MKKIHKFVIVIFCSILVMSFFSFNAKGAVTIGNSTFPADEGAVHTLEMTYCHPALNATHGIGSYMNITVEDIGQGSHFSITHALLVNATIGYFSKNYNAHQIIYEQDYIVYNASQHYFDSSTTALLIIPTPLNFTMICDFFDKEGYTCTRDGTTIKAELFNEIHTYRYNSTGFLTYYKLVQEGELILEYGFNGGNGGGIIPFGYHFLIYILIGALALIYLEKRKIK